MNEIAVGSRLFHRMVRSMRRRWSERCRVTQYPSAVMTLLCIGQGLCSGPGGYRLEDICVK
jgi:hypothetical protein